MNIQGLDQIDDIPEMIDEAPDADTVEVDIDLTDLTVESTPKTGLDLDDESLEGLSSTHSESNKSNPNNPDLELDGDNANANANANPSASLNSESETPSLTGAELFDKWNKEGGFNINPASLSPELIEQIKAAKSIEELEALLQEQMEQAAKANQNQQEFTRKITLAAYLAESLSSGIIKGIEGVKSLVSSAVTEKADNSLANNTAETISSSVIRETKGRIKDNLPEEAVSLVSKQLDAMDEKEVLSQEDLTMLSKVTHSAANEIKQSADRLENNEHLINEKTAPSLEKQHKELQEQHEHFENLMKRAKRIQVEDELKDAKKKLDADIDLQRDFLEQAMEKFKAFVDRIMSKFIDNDNDNDDDDDLSDDIKNQASPSTMMKGGR